MTEPQTADPEGFADFLRTAGKAAGLHGSDLSWLTRTARRVEAGVVITPPIVARIAGLLGRPVDEVLAHAPPFGLKKASTSRAHPEFMEALTRALVREGLTLSEATARSALPYSAPGYWAAGRYVPRRHHVERLAAVVNEPGLLDLTPTQPYRIRMQCRECDVVKEFFPGALRSWLKQSLARGIGGPTVDWQQGRGVYTCGRCSNSRKGKAFIRRVTKRGGKAKLYWKGHRLADWMARHPEVRRDALQRAVDARRGVPLSEIARLRFSLGRLALNPRGRFALCRVCERLTFVRDKKDVWSHGEYHLVCYSQWQAGPEMRAWHSLARRQRRKGLAVPPMPLPPRGRGRRPSSDELRDAYETTVRYFLQCEGSKRAIKDEYGQPVSMRGLARDHLHLSESELYRRVAHFLELLPEPGVASGPVAVWREVFTALRGDNLGAAAGE